jgi:hypothetical protein
LQAAQQANGDQPAECREHRGQKVQRADGHLADHQHAPPLHAGHSARPKGRGAGAAEGEDAAQLADGGDRNIQRRRHSVEVADGDEGFRPQGEAGQGEHADVRIHVVQCPRDAGPVGMVVGSGGILGLQMQAG